MGLLGDFLLGAVSQGGREILDRRLAEERRAEEQARQDAVYERARAAAEADYQRRRADAVEDAKRVEAERIRRQAEAEEAALRKQAENNRAQDERAAKKAEQGAGLITLSQMPGLLQSELDAAKRGQNPFAKEVADESGGHSAPDEERFKKVMAEYNRNLMQTTTGVKPKDLEEAAALGKIRQLIEQGKPEEAARLKRAMEGKGDVEIRDGVMFNHVTKEVSALPAREKPAGGGEPDKRADAAQARLEKLYAQRAEQADKDFARAEEGVAKASGSTKQAQKLAQDRLTAAQGRVNTARRELEHVLRTGTMPENEAGPTGSDAMGMARAEAVSSNQPVQYDIGGKRGTFAAGTGAAQAPAPAKTYQPAPREPAQRKVGEVYSTPRGPLMWMGNGWKVVD